MVRIMKNVKVKLKFRVKVNGRVLGTQKGFPENLVGIIQAWSRSDKWGLHNK